MQELRPTFFVIGAPKCGTTSLHFYLDQHPAVSMSSLKEPHVYAQSRSLQPRADYRGLFKPGTGCRGESSTGYSRFPAEGDAARRIHAEIPEARFIYVVGDPVERIVSDYAQQVAVGTESLSLEDALRDFEDPANFYVCASRYATQARNYLRYFEPSALLVVEQWRLRHERQQAMAEIFAFLGVDPHFTSPSFRSELASREDHVRYGSVLWKLRSSRAGAAYRRLPVAPRLRVSRLVRARTRVPRPSMRDDLRAGLAELLSGEIDQLRKLVGDPLPHLPGRVCTRVR